MLLLSELLGSRVGAADGVTVGRLVDLTVVLGPDHPSVRHMGIGRGRHVRRLVTWEEVAACEPGRVELKLTATALDQDEDPGHRPEGELRLRRDVLDTQVVDVAGKRLARVSDVQLARTDHHLDVVGVEVGAAGIWRRLGLQRLASRLPVLPVDWSDLHLTSTHGQALQLEAPASVVHRLGPSELASVVAHLPTGDAAAVLGSVPSSTAARALSAAHPRVGARLLDAAGATQASAWVAHLPTDDAASLLRRLPDHAVDRVLGEVASERAATLRRLLAHRAGTAGGLMNTSVLTAPEGEPVEAIRARVADHLPELEGMACVFVVDAEHRPVGSYEPNDLLAGRSTPRQVPTLPSTLPVDRVIDLFALHDYLALPVVDADGRLLGAVAVDDVLEELLAERLPGHRRLPHWGRRARTPHRRTVHRRSAAR